MNLVGDDWRTLPVVEALPRILNSLRDCGAVILSAEPGAGKTTLVPLAIAHEPDLAHGKVLVLEPRRIAARAAAMRMAALTGTAPGGFVGYATRLDSRLSAQTRVEVVTEGVLVRRLMKDAALEDVGTVVFDEFHERSLDADLALALLLDMREGLRPDLRLVVMSATLATPALAAMIPSAEAIAVPGRTFAVDVAYLDRPPLHELAGATARACQRALKEGAGDVLAFLPGEAEIRRTAEALGGGDDRVKVCPLYASLPDAAQDEAIRPAADGRRKIVLATTIAETSLTIEGVTAVVDSGYKRAPRYDARRGVTRLRTVRVSLAAAEQRKGRAGRLGPGRCFRLWPEAETRQFDQHDEPEILSADLATLVLTLAAWGVSDVNALRWIDTPPAGRVAEAKALLATLGAIDGDGRITEAGKRMVDIPAHPRLAHMIEAAHRMGAGSEACRLAAILSEPDPLRPEDGADIATRLDLVSRGGRSPGFRQRVMAASGQLRRAAGIGEGPAGQTPLSHGVLVALAWPDRIAMRRGAEGRFLMTSGGGARVEPADPLAREAFLAIADLDFGKDAQEARVRLASPLTLVDIEHHFADRLETRDRVAWDSRQRAVAAVRERRLGALVLDSRPLRSPEPETVSNALLQGVRELGIEALPWTPQARALQARVAFLRGLDPEAWPDLSDQTLRVTLDEWLLPHVSGMQRIDDLSRLDLFSVLSSAMPYAQARDLDRLAPAGFDTPLGRRIPIDYAAEGGPTVSVRLQDMFGTRETPRVAGGRVPLRFALLSPAQRPVALTQDLAGFWEKGYHDVRRDLRGRYPKHAWPDDPATAAPGRPARPR